MGFVGENVDVSNFNSGFLGFTNNVGVDQLSDIIARIYYYDKSLLSNWEIEQAIWSVLFGSFGQCVNLDEIEKDYVASGYWPMKRIQNSVMAHFVGSVRFRNLNYPRLARRVVSELKRGCIGTPPQLNPSLPEEQ